MGDTVLSLKNISKVFPGVVALDNVSFDLHKGEILALMGENGAGKSTLIKCLTGAHAPSSGIIEIFGKEYTGLTPALAKKLGIGAVYQEFTLVPDLPIVENVYMGNLFGNGYIVNTKKMHSEAKKLFDRFGIDIDLDAKVSTLSPAMMQIVEIVKAVSLHTKILVLDEPTAPLTINEVDSLFKIVKTLKQEGVAIIYISHRLEEIFQISDRIVIMRDGQYVTQYKTNETDRPTLVKAMIGKELNDTGYPHHNVSTDEIVLKANNITGNGVSNISFELHKGEILGFGGLVGAGRTELMSVIFGDVKKESGTLEIKGKEYTFSQPYQAIEKGIGLLPEDRKQRGLLLDKSILANISMASLKKFCKFGVIDKKEENKEVSDYIKQLGIKTPSEKQEAQFLSGGNQQKVIVAKWLATDSDVLIFDEPTRGIDVGAKFEIYKLMHSLVEKGKSIIMVSSDFEELTGMSDRIIVLAEGQFAGQLNYDEFDRSKMLDLASGTR